MDTVDEAVASEIGALFGAAVHKPHKPATDEGLEDLFEKSAEVCVDRIELHSNNGSVCEELGHEIEGWDRCDVPGAEHDGHRTVGLLFPVETSRAAPDIRLGESRLHPHVGGVPAEEEPVLCGDREDTNGDLSVRECAD